MLSSMHLRLSQLFQLPLIKYVGLCAFGLPKSIRIITIELEV